MEKNEIEDIDPLEDLYKTGNVYKNVSETRNVTETYYDKLLATYRANQNRDHSYWHPSTVGSCGLKNLLDYYKLPGNNYTTMRSIQIFNEGHLIHSKFQRNLADVGVLYGWWECRSCKKIMGEEVKPYGITKPKNCSHCSSGNSFDYVEIRVSHKDLNIAGNTDGVIKLGEDYPFQGIDFKSCSQYAFVDVIENKNKNNPINYHVVQLNVYMWLLDLESGYILYENRNKMIHKEFYCKRDDDIIDKVVNQTRYLNELVKRRAVPSMNDPHLFTASEVGPESMQCQGYPGFAPCHYYHKCFPRQFIAKGGSVIYQGKIKV